MTDYIRENRVLEIMPDDQIRQWIREQLQQMGNAVETMVLTWGKTRTEYVLEIVLTGERRNAPECLGIGQKTSHHLKIGHVNACEYDALNKLSMEGRRLYFRLRKEFPMLRRKLSVYKYLRM